MPDVTTEQALNLAIQHHQAGRIAEAQAIHRQILAREPNNADALHLLGVIAYQTGRRQEAVKLIQRAIAINPNNAIYHNNLGIAFRVMGQFDQAANAYQKAVGLKPDYADAYYNLGITLQSAGKLQEALAAYQSAIRYKPDFPDAYLNLGNTFQELNQNDQAIAAYREAIGIKSNYSDAYYNLGNILKDVGMVDQAIAACRKAVEIKPDSATAHDNLLLTLLYHPGSSGRQIFQELARWNLRHAEPLKKFILPHTNNREPERRLKIGYVSGDFQKHVVGWNLLPLLHQHNRKQLEIFCYSSTKSPDDLTKCIQDSADVWRNIADVDDQKAAQMIRDDQIDILVDLSLHSGNNRLLVFARKPAPVQVTYLGYAGSTGLDTIDYRFSDPYLDPPES
ncbi:MAG TPA: tetratricopeptide repeat protein, partial [Phycisphaerae bacterium]|nr:tetratricopeptide repeat protein [Phycisphaerae bacterium]